MIRTITSIYAALQFTMPQLQPRTEVARELRALGAEHRLDPFTIVAVVERESGGDVNAIGKLGEIGLGQIMPSNFPSCRDDPEGERCFNLKEMMRDWRMNLRMAAGLMAIQREYCRRQVGSALAIYWLQEYGGNYGTCGHVKRNGRWVALPVPKAITRVLARRRELARRFD